MINFLTKRLFALLFLCTVGSVLLGSQRNQPSSYKPSAEVKAIEFLVREVPAWSKNNGCFSCHNDGDAARALYAASRKGYEIPQNALSATTAWVVNLILGNRTRGSNWSWSIPGNLKKL